MEQAAIQKYEGLQFVDDFGVIKSVKEFFNGNNMDIAHQMIGIRWPDGTVFKKTSKQKGGYWSGQTIMEIQRRGWHQFSVGDAVVTTNRVTNGDVRLWAFDGEGVGYDLLVVPRIVEILDQNPASNAIKVGSPYMWGKVVVEVAFIKSTSKPAKTA